LLADNGEQGSAKSNQLGGDAKLPDLSDHKDAGRDKSAEALSETKGLFFPRIISRI
jgi:hypothetical protein